MKPLSKDIKAFSLQDFLTDESFIAWVKNPNGKYNAFWSAALLDHPEKLQMINSAKEIINSFNYKVDSLTDAGIDQLWRDISQETSQNERKVFKISNWLRAVVAVLIMGILISVIYRKFVVNQAIEVIVPYGETRTVFLPDSSKIVLNANSKLTYHKNWDGKSIREVWINGEGFFSIAHLHRSGAITAGQRFIVHAAKTNVEVLGTTFNLSSRHEVVKVALVTGKVLLRSGANLSYIMKPGDIVQHTGDQDTIVKRRGATAKMAVWQNGELNFDNTPVIEICQYIEDIYGYKVILKDPAIGKRMLTGTFTTKTEDDLIKILKATLNLSVVKNNKNRQLIISN